jgi:hypothetical protein
LFKFDPLAFTVDPIWIKKTIGSSQSNCGILGLTFGRYEKIIYSFSWFD